MELSFQIQQYLITVLLNFSVMQDDLKTIHYDMCPPVFIGIRQMRLLVKSEYLLDPIVSIT